MTTLADPTDFATLTSGVEPFPDTFTTTVEWSPSTDPGDTPSWEDITDYVRSGSIKRGRTSEFDRTAAGTMSLELDNRDRTFDPTVNADARPNKRIRASTSAGSAYLNATGAAGSGAWTPATAAMIATTGDLDVRVRVALTDWTPSSSNVLLSRSMWVPNQGAFVFAVDTTGKLQLVWTPDGTGASTISKLSTVAVGAVDGQPRWVRATLDVSNAGNNEVKFYTSTDSTNDHTAVTWTQLGSTVTTAGTTSVFASTSVLVVAAQVEDYNNATGHFYAAAMLNGIDGTVVANPIFTTMESGATGGYGQLGELWAINPPATLPAGYVTHQFDGWVDGLPQSYGPPNDATVALTATDGFKLLSRFDLDPIYQPVVEADAPRGWWRLADDLPRTMTAVDSSGNGHHATYRGNPQLTQTLLTDGPGGVSFDGEGDGATTTSGLLSATPCTAEAWVKTGKYGTNEGFIFGQTHAEGSIFVRDVVLSMDNDTGVAKFTARRVGESNVTVTGTTVLRDTGVHHLVGTIDTDKKLRLYVDGVLEAGPSAAATGTSLDASGRLRIGIPPVNNETGAGTVFKPFKGDVCEVAWYDRALSSGEVTEHHTAGAAPWEGDTTGDRVDRVLDLVGWPAGERTIDGGASTLGAAVNIEGSTALDHLLAVEATEQGRFFVGGDGAAQFFSRTHETTLLTQAEYTDHEIGDLEFDYDDSNLQNDVTVTRAGGLPQRATDDTSVGLYWRQSADVDTLHETDDEALAMAQWRIANYAYPTVRPTGVTLKPMRDLAILYPGIMARELGDRIRITRTLSGDDIAVDAVIEGISHSFAPGNRWVTQWNLSPLVYGMFGPGGGGGNQYVKLDDTTLGKLDSSNRLAF